MTTQIATAEPVIEEPTTQVIKVLVWDLDNTLWDGTLLESDDVRPRADAVETIKALDGRGILHSIASKNEFELAMAKLREHGLDELFIYPQINWSSKAANIETIAKSINIGIDAVAFIDDQPFEREEVQHAQSKVLVLDPATDLAGLTERPEFIPRFITDESAIRRQMYRADIERNRQEDQFVGPSEEYLASLGMVFRIGRAREEDLKRAEELTVRTHQLNTTGYTYNYDELDALRKSDDHLLLVASLDDKFGTYGKIGLVLIEFGDEVWGIRLLLMSCRVMARGVGTVLINYLLSLARDAGVRLQAEFKTSDRNRQMLVTYKFAGFREVQRDGDLLLFENPLDRIQPFPDYIEVEVEPIELARRSAGA